MSESTSPVVTKSAGPSGPRVALITALAAIASLVVNAGLVWLATAFDPAVQHFSHFRLADYGTLTVVGVGGTGVAWYLSAHNLATPRRTFFRIAVVAMLVLWVPDLWLLLKHEPTRAVVFLVMMHLSVALITYNALVFAAPAGDGVSSRAVAPQSMPSIASDVEEIRVPRVAWTLLMIAVGVEFVSGMVGLLYVPFHRPNGLLVHRGEAVYLIHAAFGGLLGVAAVAIFLRVSSSQQSAHRVDHIAALSGLCGVAIGAIGGVMCALHPLRLAGMALMFVGLSVAFFGYLIPMIDDARPQAPGPVSSQ